MNSPSDAAAHEFRLADVGGINYNSENAIVMWKALSTCVFALFATTSLFAQQSKVALEGDHGLQDRYFLLKSKSQTFNNYKVINESILDGFWKITMDSVRQRKAEIAIAGKEISRLEGELTLARNKVIETDKTLAESEYERSHINVLGIPFSKSFFLTLMAIFLAALIIMLVTSVGSVRFLRKSNKEKDLNNMGITSEFDEFRKKALEKEVKLSRELQSERNKLATMMKTN